jgi:predicted RNase H-like HicB family nuclease
MTPNLKIIVERHADGYVAYPLGLERGVVIGQGDSYESALSDVRSALAFHAETFGPESLTVSEDDGPVLEAFVAEVALPA